MKRIHTQRGKRKHCVCKNNYTYDMYRGTCECVICFRIQNKYKCLVFSFFFFLLHIYRILATHPTGTDVLMRLYCLLGCSFCIVVIKIYRFYALRFASYSCACVCVVCSTSLAFLYFFI